MATITDIFLVALFTVFLHLQQGYCDKVAGKIYSDLKSVVPCVILTNATHQIGCTSSMGGHVGVVHFIQSQADVDWLVSHGDHVPYVPLFTSEMFNEKTMKVLTDKKIINGAMVVFVGKNGLAPEDGFSPDYECPNERFGMYHGNSNYGSCQKVTWNKQGNGMSFVSYGIPIFALYDQSEVDYLIKCFNDNNKPVNGSIPDYPLCAVELKDFMFAAKDTPTCMRKSQILGPTQNQFCDPLGDYNVWGTLYPLKEAPKEGDIVLAAAKMDSSSFFHDLVHGADNDASGVIALLAAAKVLGDMKRNKTIAAPKKPIMFVLFQGESWDYIGSSRMVYEMNENLFPTNSWEVQSGKAKKQLKLNTSDIGYFIELNQVGMSTEELWAHSDPLSRVNSDVDTKVVKLINVLKEASSKTNMKVKDASPKKSNPLPPASFQRFLLSNKKIPGIVLTDHQGQFKNQYYNSRFDDPFNVQGNFSRQSNSSKIHLSNNFTERLAHVATTLANTLYTLANDNKPPEKPLIADKVLIGHLVYCTFFRTDCDLHKEVFSTDIGKKLTSTPISRYVSVNTANNTLTLITHNLLLYFTGQHLPPNATCSSEGPYTMSRMRGSGLESGDICVKGNVYFSKAESPAFLLKDYASTEYSTWAESTWNADLAVRMFLVSNPQHQAITLVCGILITLLSFIFVYFVHRKADQLFTPLESAPATTLDS